MLKGKQLLLTILSVVFFGLGFFFISTNFFTPVSIQLLDVSIEELPLGVPLLLSGLLLAAGMYFKMTHTVVTNSHQQNKLQQKQEKAEATAESSAAEKQALQAKIDTLETALEKALEKSAPTA